MKNLFGVDAKDGCATFESFKIRSLDKEDQEKLDKLRNDFEKAVKKAYPPFGLVIAARLLLLLSIVFGLSLFITSDGIAHALQDRGWIFYIAFTILPISLFFSIKFDRQAKKANKSKELKDKLSEFEVFSAQTDLQLGIPVGPYEIDVLCPYVKKDRKGKEKLDSLPFLSFVNMGFRVFKEDDLLCFADIHSVVGVHSASMKSLSFIDNKIAFPEWNKDKGIKSSKYKQYRISNSNGIYTVRGYWVLSFERDEEEYSIMVPCYDGDIFVDLIKELRPDLVNDNQ